MMFNIFDTREPEGDGGPIKHPVTGEIKTFDTEIDARTWAVSFGYDLDRVTIAPSVE